MKLLEILLKVMLSLAVVALAVCGVYFMCCSIVEHQETACNIPTLTLVGAGSVLIIWMAGSLVVDILG